MLSGAALPSFPGKVPGVCSMVGFCPILPLYNDSFHFLFQYPKGSEVFVSG